MTLTAIFSITLILFTVIDIVGCLPIIIDMKRQGIRIESGKTTLVSGMLMISFLFFGASMLKVFGVEIASFALAGSLIIFFIGLEMVLGMRFFRDQGQGSTGSIVPMAFPIIAGAGTLTTILSLKARYDNGSIIVGILINLLLIFLVLYFSNHLERKLSDTVTNTLRKVFGIILIAIAFQMFKANILE
jgi:multiple antibiotic resistance protein